ncbi:MAG: tRNA (cytidine(34)-2'-O)-methyltransferase [Planctomycetes bacterium]|nr:tRNA (cytidine(34)-2'-O)-methyltransferase [Planctomycetota bacterium]
MSDSNLHVVLVAPEIAWNTGNAGRTCLAAGARLHLVEPLGFSLDERAVRRAGVHYWKHVQPSVWPAWPALAARLGELGEPFFFTACEGRDLRATVFPARAVLVFGCESAGLPAAIRDAHADRLVTIPMRAHEGISLNVSTAVGIAVYEVLRQRPTRGEGR